jgi:hypothetical protein
MSTPGRLAVYVEPPMSRARGQSPVSARPLLAELSDLVADLGMEAP